MKLQTAKGVKDVPPEEKIIKNELISTLKEVFELYGFVPLETPVLERYDTLAAKFAAGEASDALKEIFKLKDQGKRDLGLRFDLTVPLARYVAMNPTLKLPFKRYQVGPVFRDGPIKLGRYREFWQMDIDTVGSASMLADAEILAMTEACFKKIDFNVVIKVNNRKLINGILEQAGVKKKEEAIIALDKLTKIGEKGVTDEFLERGLTKQQAKKALSLIKTGITLKELEKKITNEESKEGLNELKDLFSFLKKMRVKAIFDISLARGLAYYTGTVFEVFLKKSEITSSVAGGGRYDNMIGNYMGGSRVVPAVGIAFGLAPIMDAYKLQKKISKKTAAKAFVIPINTLEESLNIVQELRSNGIPTDFALGKKGVSKNLEYANCLSIPYVIIIGEDELKKNKVLLRDMSSGTETLLSIKDVIRRLK